MLALRRKPPLEDNLPDPARARASAPRFSISIALAIGHAWRERARYRWELSQLSARDLADIRVPPGLAADEARRWPWQKPSRRWREIAVSRRASR